MKRKITDDLLRWKSNQTARKPLLLSGARQTGKTYTLREFGEQNYVNVVYINLGSNRNAAAFFKRNIDPERTLEFLENESGIRIVPQETLVILDDIHSCRTALMTLKQFQSKKPEYHIAGIWNFTDNRNFSVPRDDAKVTNRIGQLSDAAVDPLYADYVDPLTIYPLDFEEYLLTLGEDRLCDLIKTAFEKNKALRSPMHSKALDLFRLYLVTGGMPGAVREYTDTGSFDTVPDVQRRIMEAYISDFSYSVSGVESKKTLAVYNSVPEQLAKENKKFQYRLVQKGGTAAVYSAAIDRLVRTGAVLRCNRIEEGYMPISSYRDYSAFKLYMNDVGLLTAQSGISRHDILMTDESGDSNHDGSIGFLSENYVVQALTCKKYDLYYWSNDGVAEVDFILRKGNKPVPVEVRTGTRSKSRSINLFNIKYKSSYSIRISESNFGYKNNVKSVPLYAVFCI